MALMGIAGELAAEKAAGPGGFQVCFLDALYGIKKVDIEKRLKMVTTGFKAHKNKKRKA